MNLLAHRAPVKPEPNLGLGPLETIPLADAQLCAECQVVHAAPSGACPACGCSSSLRLVRILGVVGEPRLRLIPGGAS